MAPNQRNYRSISRKMRLKLKAFATVVLALTVASCGSEDLSKPNAELNRAAGRALDLGVPGAAVLVGSGENQRFVASGFADLKAKRPFLPNDVVRVASISKAVSAAVILQLVEDGSLGLADRVSLHVPGLLSQGNQITIRQLLQHTSGLPDYTKSESFLASFRKDPKRVWRPRELVGVVARDKLNFKPGSRYRYSDTDNIVLGLIVESVTGKSYASELKRRIFDPLKLEKTRLATTTKIAAAHAHGYEIEDTGSGQQEIDVTSAVSPTGAWASGAIVSTPTEISRFMSAFVDGTLIKSRKLRGEMMKTVSGESSPAGPGRNRSGLGIFHYRLRCGQLWGHTGQFPGFRSFVASSKNGKKQVVVFINATGISDSAASAALRLQRLAACQALNGP